VGLLVLGSVGGRGGVQGRFLMDWNRAKRVEGVGVVQGTRPGHGEGRKRRGCGAL
jgi:hypothetical protein